MMSVKNKLRLSRKNGMVLISVLIVGLLAAMLAYQINTTNSLREENKRLSTPGEAAKLETAQLKADVAKLIQLPNEEPTVATVTDVAKLKTQQFFANARNGDRVLIFPQAKKAILYRPSTGKIVEVAPINIGNNQTNTTSQPVNDDKKSASDSVETGSGSRGPADDR